MPQPAKTPRILGAARRRTFFSYSRTLLCLPQQDRKREIINPSVDCSRARLQQADANARARRDTAANGYPRKLDPLPAALSGGNTQTRGIGRAMALDADADAYLTKTRICAWIQSGSASAWTLMRRVAENARPMLNLLQQRSSFARETRRRGFIFMDEGRNRRTRHTGGSH